MTATPRRADLPTLAAEAILGAEPWVRYNPTDMLVDAVLAAVLPEHRRLVLAEAAERLVRECETPESDDCAVIAAHLAEWAEQPWPSAAAAPPDSPSATVPAEPVPAVPEATPGGFHEPDEPTDHIAAAFDAGTHGRTAPPRGQTQRLDVAAEAIRKLTAERDEAQDGTRRAWLELEHWRTVIVPELIEQRDRLGTDRDRLAAQVAHYQRVVEAAKALVAAIAGATEEDDWDEEPFPTRLHELAATVDALSDAGTDQTEDQ